MTDGADSKEWGDIETNRWGCLLNVMITLLICGIVAVPVGLAMLIFGDSDSTALLVMAIGACIAVAVRVPGRVYYPSLLERSKAMSPPPRRVQEVARARQLGEHLWTRKGANPVIMGCFILVVVLIVLVVSVNVFLALGAFAGVLALEPLLIAVIMPFMALLLIPRGFHRTYLFTGGLVHSNNGFLHACTWHDIERVEEQYEVRKGQATGRKTHYFFVTRRPRRFGSGNKTLKVRELSRKDGVDPFYQHVVDAARRENIRVVPSKRVF